MTAPPAIGSILLASTDPGRLRAWYERAFGMTADVDGFLRFGGVGLLIDGRQDVAARPAEPARVIVNLHVADARAIAYRLDAAGVTWVAGLEYREAAGAWFGTVLDADGNYVQIIELTDAYWAARRQRTGEDAAGTPSTGTPSAGTPAGGTPAGGAETGGTRTGGALAAGAVTGRLPAQDLDRARRFYAQVLGLEPVEERPGGLRYECAAGGFSLFASAGRPSGEHTQLAWQVADIEAAVAELRGRGVVFETVDLPGLRTVGGIAEVAGNYPSAGAGERGAWFRDSEGNMLALGQALPAAPATG
jgi:predicted enzyme related to lactoylglutathione lyase